MNKFIILGCGSSLGSPTITNYWGACDKNNKKKTMKGGIWSPWKRKKKSKTQKINRNKNRNEEIEEQSAKAKSTAN